MRIAQPWLAGYAGVVQRIGLYGGSFDPVHLGHRLVARAAREELALSAMLFIPAAQSPFKTDQPLAPASARCAMLRLALAGETACEIDNQELDRGGVSYTIDTVREVARRHPGASLFYLIGADHLAKLPSWREADALAQRVDFVVLPRPGEEGTLPPAPFRARFLQGFPLGLSSSQIRARRRHRQPIDHLVAPAVAEYIYNNGLYL